MFGISLILGWRPGAGKIVDMGEMQSAVRQPQRERLDDIGFDQLEPRLPFEMTQIRAAAGDIIVEANDPGVRGEQSVAQVGADEAGTARDERNLAMSPGQRVPLPQPSIPNIARQLRIDQTSAGTA
jgi:hypothetical protein